jgi:hypothetical protein
MRLALKIVCYFGGLYMCEANAMEPDWGDIVAKTAAKTFVLGEEGHCQEADKIFSWDRCSIDWVKVEQSANAGNRVAQYALAAHLFDLSGKLFNGERIKMRTCASMYALISAIVGELGVAQNEYIEGKCNLEKNSTIPDFLKEAEQIAVKENF